MATRTLHHGQPRLIFDESHRDHLVLAGVGYGKTHLGPPWHARRVFKNPNSRESLVVAPTNKLLKKCLEFYVDFLLTDLEFREGRHGDFQVNKSDPSITFLPGYGRTRPHIVWFVSGEAPERIISYTISHAWLDEAALMKEQVKKNVYKRLRCPHARTKRQVLYTTTPEGLNWLYDHFHPDKVERKEGTVFSEGQNKLVLHGRSHDNPYLDEEYLIETLEEEFSWDPAYYANYVLGEFVSLSKDRFYFSFDERNNIIDFPLEDAFRQLHLTFDNNVGRMAWSAIQNVGGQWIVVKSNRANGRNIEDCCSQIVEMFPPVEFRDWDLNILGDAALHCRSVQTRTTGYEVIKSLLSQNYNRIRVSAPRGNPLVEERSRRTNSLFAKRQLFIDRSCSKVIHSAKVSESDGKGGIKKPKDDDVTHAMEAVDHAMLVLQPLKIERRGAEGVTF